MNVDYLRKCESVMRDHESYKDFLVECATILREDFSIEIEHYSYDWLTEYQRKNAPSVAVDNFHVYVAKSYGISVPWN